jgi:uncharacterized protein YlxW (UPF0749 family)
VSGPRPRWQGADLLDDLFRQPLDPGYAQAAARRAAAGDTGAAGRPPVWSARVLRLTILVAAGFLLAVAYQQVVASAPVTSRARADLAADVAARRAEADGLGRTADRLRDDVSKRRDEALAADPELARLRDLEARTGLGRVTGDGVMVKLNDAPAQVDPVTGRAKGDNPGRVLDRDLQDVANALWAAGAEAIAVNGQRLTATTTIRAAGSAILVDYRPVTGPYTIEAIGPDGLDRRLLDSPTGKRFRRYAETYRMLFEVRAKGGLTLPPGPDPGLRHARPPTPPSPSPSQPGPSPSRGAR